MKKIISGFILFLFCFVHSSCSAVMALRQPDKKNLSVLNSGISRENVIMYLGAPASSRLESQERVEIYQFKPGHTGAAKASRALIYGITDVLTLFITEIFWIPSEILLSQKDITIKVIYDQADKVKDVIVLKKD